MRPRRRLNGARLRLLIGIGKGIEGDPEVESYNATDFVEAELGGFVVVLCAEGGKHVATDVADFGIVEDTFEAVANLDPALDRKSVV